MYARVWHMRGMETGTEYVLCGMLRHHQSKPTLGQPPPPFHHHMFIHTLLSSRGNCGVSMWGQYTGRQASFSFYKVRGYGAR